MEGPWIFGWNQLLTVVGLAATIGFAFAGLRTFDSWKKEKLEERKIEIAFDALALAHESKFVFAEIRSPMSYEYEWKEMPSKKDETEQSRSERGSYYAVLQRLIDHKDFSERVWKLQPRVMALFGDEVEPIFEWLHSARSMIYVSARTLTWELPIPAKVQSEEDLNLRLFLRGHLWGTPEDEVDVVEENLKKFRGGIERLCRPVVDQKFRALPAPPECGS